MDKNYHLYHIVSCSPWPVFVGVSCLGIICGIISLFKSMSVMLLFFSLMFTFMVVIYWWRDVIRESYFEGCHTSNVVGGLKYGMILFIVSEVFFFLSFFWAYFHFSLSPSMEVGVMWPPCGLMTFSPFQIPLLNTIILLSSGVSITWAHQMLLMEENKLFSRSLALTWVLGLYFLILQIFEYSEAMFDISDSVYGSIFFMATGFHGFHVMVGTIFLITMWIRVENIHFSSYHHFGFEAAAWYWHFVDVVWLFLFVCVYWWGS